MTPDAIVIVPAGIVPLGDAKPGWRSTTYEESDAFGPLGGRDRVRAAALLAKRYPEARMVNIAHTKETQDPSAAEVYCEELLALGVDPERLVVTKETAHTTLAGLRAALALGRERGWSRLVFVSSGFHIPRLREFLRLEEGGIESECVASEPLIAAVDSAFAEHFAAVEKSSAYKKRLEAEARGIAAIKSGTYKSAPLKDKRER